MVSYSNSFLITYNIIFFITSIYLYYDIVINFCYVNTNKHYFIIHEVKEKRYIEYIPKIILCSKDKNIPAKEFAYKNYEIFCYCKNNTNYRVYNKSLCLSSKECDPHFKFLIDNYKFKYLYIWNKQKIIINNKQTYNFLQGINNSTGKCDINYKYKKCGYLIDLNSEFCVKENEICPFNHINIKFYLKNLTDDILFLYKGNKIKIDNKYEIEDFLPDFHINNNINNYNSEVIDSTNLLQFTFDNNIPYLKEILNETMRNVIIDLVLLKNDNSSIKYNYYFFQEKILIVEFKMNYEYTYYFLIWGFFCIILSEINTIQKLIKNDYDCFDIFMLILKSIFSLFLTSILLYFYSSIKLKIDKEYILDDEYYLQLKSIRNVIIDIIIVTLVSEYELFFILLKSIKNKFISRYKRYFCCNKNRDSFNFIDIK